MVNIIVELSKYSIILLITMYTFLCFSIFGYQDPDKKQAAFKTAECVDVYDHIIAFLVMYLETEDIKMLVFYLAASGTSWGYYSAVYLDLSESIKTGR